MDSNPSDTPAIDDVPQTLEPTLQDSRETMAHYKEAMTTLRTERRAQDREYPGQLKKNQ